MRRTIIAVVLALAAGLIAVSVSPATAQAQALGYCGQSGTPPQVAHVIVVMMENLSYNQVVGSADAPFQNELASQCGVGSNYWGVTHTSAANYLAISAGEYPPASPPGCGSVKTCTDPSQNLYWQLNQAGLSWANFVEAMPSNCDPESAGAYFSGHNVYTIGHNPALFYPDDEAQCPSDDIAEPNLLADSGPFYSDLENQTLPSFSMVIPDTYNDDEGPGSKAQNELAADQFLQSFTALVTSSPSYQAGNTLLLITYDEGTGSASEAKVGENCTNQAADLAGSQPSCQVPLFVVYPYTPPGADSTFFDHYSITATTEMLFGLPLLANAATAPLLTGHFGIPGAASPPPPPSGPCGTASTANYTHVIWIFEENHSYGSIIGNSQAPYLNSLASECGLATNYHNITHPSTPNYIAATSGLSLSALPTQDYWPLGWSSSAPSKGWGTSAQSIFGQTSWRSYEESMPSNCYKQNSGNYDVNHNPATYYTSLTGCAVNDVPYTQLATDLASGNLPAFSFIAPNIQDDMHTGTIAQGDAWLQANLPTILNSSEYRSGSTVVFITWDEGEGGTSNDCAANTTDVGCQVPALVISPTTTPGTQSSTLFNHYSLLATTEQLLGLPLLGDAQTANDMASAFGL